MRIEAGQRPRRTICRGLRTLAEPKGKLAD